MSQINIDLTPQITGSNSTFSIAPVQFVPGSTLLVLNGAVQRPYKDYVENANATSISTQFTPLTTDVLTLYFDQASAPSPSIPAENGEDSIEAPPREGMSGFSGGFMPNMSSAFMNWGSSVQLMIVNTALVDFEAASEVLQTPTVSMMITAMSPRKVQYKEEGERRWKWWEGISTTRIDADTQLQDPEGLQYRIRAVTDWGQAGFYRYEMTQMPAVVP